MTDGSAREAEPTLVGMLVLSAAHSDAVSLTALQLEGRDWRIYTAQGPSLATGDGAVLL